MNLSFPPAEIISEMTAKMLIEIEAVHFRSDEPFRFTSGWASPVYIDCRKLISYPRLRQTIIDFGASILLRDAGFERFDAVAGGETAGIPFAAWMADRLMLPMQYVRKQPKGFGRDAQIEGHLVEGQRILLVEDLTTDGRSITEAIRCPAIRFGEITRSAPAFWSFLMELSSAAWATITRSRFSCRAVSTAKTFCSSCGRAERRPAARSTPAS